MSGPGWIDEPFYSKIKQIMPLPCVDLLVLKGLWFTPGGRVYRGESLEAAVRRVLKEETGFEPVHINQVGVMSHVWPEVHTITVFYMVHVSSDKPEMNDEHDDYKWIRAIEDDTHPYIVNMVKKSRIFDTLG
jgi:ADP-ribose pyrophosphatase YjhB (NUDIX family)